MDTWQDYIAPVVILGAAGWLVASGFALHGLWASPVVSKGRVALFGTYIVITIAVAAGYEYVGAQNLRSSRETAKLLHTLLALAGLPSGNVNSGLDQLITRNLQPRQIIPTQENALANEIELLKGIFPKRMAITTLPSPGGEVWNLVEPIIRAFARNGISLPNGIQSTSSPKQTGIMFSMRDPTNPPDFALQLRGAFEAAGIRDIKFIPMDDPAVASAFDFTIFVGPAPLK